MPCWRESCPSCPNQKRYRAIGGDGPQPARVLVIGERPGPDENRFGTVFVGKSGQELNELYLPLAGLDRAGVRVCNTVLCGADNNRTPTHSDIAKCPPYHLPDEIKQTQPEIVLLLGSTACALCPGINLEMHHGIPQSTAKVGDLFGWRGWVVPMYHPAIGLHESRWMQICLDDWAALKGICYSYDPQRPEPCYEHITRDDMAYLNNLPCSCPVGVDTESHDGTPFSVQLSHRAGEGFMLMANDEVSLSWLNGWLHHKVTALHNAAYDLRVLERLGIRLTRFRDTMQEAFALGNLPQGLKPLVYRLFRHTMTSYNETVRPASIHALYEWMTEAFKVAQLDLTYTEKRPKSVKEHKCDLQSLLERLLRLTDIRSDYDPWGRLNEFWGDPLNEWMTAHVESRVGRYPVLGIANCKMEDAIRYAVGDADWTGRVAVELERRRHGAFEIYDGDKDL